MFLLTFLLFACVVREPSTQVETGAPPPPPQPADGS